MDLFDVIIALILTLNVFHVNAFILNVLHVFNDSQNPSTKLLVKLGFSSQKIYEIFLNLCKNNFPMFFAYFPRKKNVTLNIRDLIEFSVKHLWKNFIFAPNSKVFLHTFQRNWEQNCRKIIHRKLGKLFSSMLFSEKKKFS